MASGLVVGCPAPEGFVGQAYVSRVYIAGGTPTVSYALHSGSSLPAGLSLNASTGDITGTPTVPAEGTHTVTFDVTDGDAGHTVVSQTCQILINPHAGPVARWCETDEYWQPGPDTLP